MRKSFAVLAKSKFIVVDLKLNVSGVFSQKKMSQKKFLLPIVFVAIDFFFSFNL